ncbi:hypothetical protein BY996DRAFT_6578876 [Phakopsora pachyrhizi]|nr:hypothetical protein BY996DRAFT_6578876 [Phakopsora pachyrhizi]
MDVNNGFFEATRAGFKKCEACRVVKGPCVFKSTPTFSEGQKVWCNPTTKVYGYEHPIQEVPTEDFDSEIVSTGKYLEFPILSKGWTNHDGVVSNQAASTTQHAKRQKANPSTLTEATRADLNTVAIGSSSDEDGDDECGGKADYLL